ncbi:MAG TPA: hypothetical protein VF516_15060 [Kofleriaceae bacterium]
MTGWTHVRAGSARLSWIAAAVLAATLPLAQGCATQGAGDPASGEEEPTGEMVLSLTQPGPHGEIYQLTNANFDISNAQGTFTINGNGFSSQLSVPMPPGVASIFLRDGWTLGKSTDGGVTFQPVSALLGSFNPIGVRVLANQPAFVRFDFLIRQTNGNLQLSFGVVTDPRELAGGFVVQTATGALADYALPQNQRMDFAVFFQLSSVESVTLADGTKQRIYTSFNSGSSFGPIPVPDGALAAEFYSDHLGILSGPVASDLTGATLTYTVAAHPDGSITVSGDLISGNTELTFAPDAIDAVLPPLDADGFPADAFFYDSDVPCTLDFGPDTITGTLRVRNLPPAP